MNIRRFLYKIAEAVVIEAVLADEQLKASYLAVVREKFKHISKLEEMLNKISRQKFFRQEIWDDIEDHLDSRIPRQTDLPNLLEQPALMYFQIFEGEEFGLTSSTIGEINKTVIPRLIVRINEALTNNKDLDPIDELSKEIAKELAHVVDEIYAFRRQFTDRVSIRLFS